MDIKSTIFTKIQQSFTDNITLFNNYKLEPIRSFDIDYGQIRNPELFEVYPTPSVFIKTMLKRQDKQHFIATVQILLAIDMPHYTDQSELLLQNTVPLNHYRYQKVIRQCVESTNMGLLFISDEEIDTENVLFFAIQTYEAYYTESKEDNYVYTEVDCDLKIILEGATLVEKV